MQTIQPEQYTGAYVHTHTRTLWYPVSNFLQTLMSFIILGATANWSGPQTHVGQEVSRCDFSSSLKVFFFFS